MVNSFTLLIGFLRVLLIIPVGCRGRSPGPEVSASHIRDSGACHGDWARKRDIQYNIILMWNLLWIFIWNLVVYISQTLQRNVSHLRKSGDLIKLCYLTWTFPCSSLSAQSKFQAATNLSGHPTNSMHHELLGQTPFPKAHFIDMIQATTKKFDSWVSYTQKTW